VALFSILALLAKRRNYSLECVHVHHGLNPGADDWAAFCGRLCSAHGVKLQIARVAVDLSGGRGVEASARLARYHELLRPDADFLLLAHHLRDQAETVLLQLMRGAGVKGLAAMPGVSMARGPRIVRPLLAEPFSEIQDYAATQKLEWVSDDSNENLRFPRNFVRMEILPVLEARYQGVTKAIARSADNLAEAQGLLDELARIDLAGIKGEGGLSIESLKALGTIRAKNVLRFHLVMNGLEPPQSSRLEELLKQIESGRIDAKVSVNLGGGVAHTYNGLLMLDFGSSVGGSETEYRWKGELDWRLPKFGGRLILTPAGGQGISARKLAQAPVTARLRRGGEKIRVNADRPTRTLKNLFQEARIPFWIRGRLPLLYCGDELAFVPGVGIAVSCQADDAEPGFVPTWSAFPVSD
jgi:tRNA(Ile)-lysidine synthase